jgi:osomolarity two-component system, response regulator SSK1
MEGSIQAVQQFFIARNLMELLLVRLKGLVEYELTRIEPNPSASGQPTNPLPTPPAQASDKPTITPPNRVSSPHPGQRPKRKKNAGRSEDATPKPASASLLDGTVPPINVLLVEDNVINLKLLEAFMKKLKVRWQSAMNGKEAVATWRSGGFHLVLMDIQLPVMNGLDATKEIRRLEAVNGIGVFSGGPIDGGQKLGASNAENLREEDKLPDRSQFKSPVIIVALTASSLQSDRHEALAAGCNDFLTKVSESWWCWIWLTFRACQLRVDGEESDGMGLYASFDRL